MGAPLRVGLLGCGAIAQVVHIPLLRRLPDVALVAVADPSPTARAAAARFVPGVDEWEDGPELLASDVVEAVVVCAPSDLHGPLAVAALKGGKHLYLEKPLAVDRAGAERAAAAASSAPAVSTIGFNRRFHPAFLRLRAQLASPQAGSLLELRTRFFEPIADSLPDWKRRRASGGGALLDLASHHIDLVRFLTRGEVELESAAIHSIASEQDEAELVLRLDSGGAAFVDVSFNRPRTDVVEARCTGGTFRADRHGGLRARLRPGWDPSYATALRSFVQRAQGATVVLPSLDDGLRSLEVVLAAEAVG